MATIPPISTLQSHPPAEAIDLTPFGFTPTESVAYASLLETGPTGGYALAKRLNIARANAYQALNGLVSKGAATMADGRPQRFKPVRPDALFAMVVGGESRKLDALEAQIRHTSSASGQAMAELTGARAIHDLVMRTAAREEAEVVCAATAAVISATAPGWRRRRLIDRSTQLWCIGAEPENLPVEINGSVDAAQWPEALRDVTLLMVAGGVGLCAREASGSAIGFWTSDPLMVGLVESALTRQA